VDDRQQKNSIRAHSIDQTVAADQQLTNRGISELCDATTSFGERVERSRCALDANSECRGVTG
jgi:hypothetical protein